MLLNYILPVSKKQEVFRSGPERRAAGVNYVTKVPTNILHIIKQARSQPLYPSSAFRPLPQYHADGRDGAARGGRVGVSSGPLQTAYHEISGGSQQAYAGNRRDAGYAGSPADRDDPRRENRYIILKERYRAVPNGVTAIHQPKGCLLFPQERNRAG